MRQWRLIRDAALNGAYNMAVDDAILNHVIQPTLRLYAWSPPCLSLGYGQKESDADLDRIIQRGWEIVRRPTGGRAILHTDELTYSLALPLDHPLAAADIVESYREISRALIKALELLGGQPRSERANKDSLRNLGPVCFEIPSHYEITVEGSKLIGSAQVRRQGKVLQHGSLPLAGDLARICDALYYPDEAAREAARANVHSRAITLSEALGHQINWETAAEAIVEGFRSVFDVAFEPGALTKAEQETASYLTATRYSTISRSKVVEMRS